MQSRFLILAAVQGERSSPKLPRSSPKFSAFSCDSPTTTSFQGHPNLHDQFHEQHLGSPRWHWLNFNTRSQSLINQVVGTPGTSAPAHNLPPIPQKILQRIAKCEYIDFADLLSDNLYPHPSLATQNQYKLEVNPQDPSALGIVPSQTVGGWSSCLAGGLECLSSNSPSPLPSPCP